MEFSSKEHKSLDQIDFEHRVALNFLLYALEEIKILKRRLDETFVANIHHDVVDEYDLQKEELDKLEVEVLKIIKFIKQLQALIEENEYKRSSINEAMNQEKHSIIIKEYQKLCSHYERVRENFFSFLSRWY